MLCKECKAKIKRNLAPVLCLVVGATLFSVPPILDSQTVSPLTVQPSTSRVGVNTPSPTEALEVAGNVKATNFIGNGSQLTNINASQWTTSGSNIYFGYNTSGNVGVGTNLPGQKLDVTGDIRTTANYRVGAKVGSTQALIPLAKASADCGGNPYISSLEITGGIITNLVLGTSDGCPD